MTKTKPVRLQALQVCQLGGYEQRLVKIGEVFEWNEAVLPPKHIAVKVPDETPLGLSLQDERELVNRKGPLPWTTVGHMKRSIRSSALAELL